MDAERENAVFVTFEGNGEVLVGGIKEEPRLMSEYFSEGRGRNLKDYKRSTHHHGILRIGIAAVMTAETV